MKWKKKRQHKQKQKGKLRRWRKKHSNSHTNFNAMKIAPMDFAYFFPHSPFWTRAVKLFFCARSLLSFLLRVCLLPFMRFNIYYNCWLVLRTLLLLLHCTTVAHTIYQMHMHIVYTKPKDSFSLCLTLLFCVWRGAFLSHSHTKRMCVCVHIFIFFVATLVALCFLSHFVFPFVASLLAFCYFNSHVDCIINFTVKYSNKTQPAAIHIHIQTYAFDESA